MSQYYFFKNIYQNRLDKILAKLMNHYSRTKIQFFIKNKQVKINGIITTLQNFKLIGNEAIEVKLIENNKKGIDITNIPLDILYEDDYLLIINKPYNLVVHPGTKNNSKTMLNSLLYYYPQLIKLPRAGIIHRLDKDTTGLIIVAKNIYTYIKLKKLLKMKNIIREYEAIVVGNMISGGTVNKPIARSVKKFNLMNVSTSGKLAITHYFILERFRYHTRIRLRLDTGRTHQIRVHMAWINFPIVGDRLYGKFFHKSTKFSKALNYELSVFNRQALHAIFLTFLHPISKVQVSFYAPIPEDMNQLIYVMKKDQDLDSYADNRS